MNGQTKIQYCNRGCFNIATIALEKNRKTIKVKTDTRTEIVNATDAMSAASFFVFVMRITLSYLPVDITLIMAVMEVTIARSPNSAGENILVRMGENTMGMACANAVPKVRINDFRAKLSLFLNESILA
jgi:hypothetical protein